MSPESGVSSVEVGVAVEVAVEVGVEVGVEVEVGVGVEVAIVIPAVSRGGFLLPGGRRAGSCSCRSIASSFAFANAAYAPASIASRAARMRSR